MTSKKKGFTDEPPAGELFASSESPDPASPGIEDVGFGKPPRRSRFKAGQSGNPKGRPKGTRNLATQVRAVLGRRIPVLEQGQRRFVSATEALLHRYLALALKGDVKAGAFLLGLLERLQPAETEEASADVLSDQDRLIVANMFRHLNKPSEE